MKQLLATLMLVNAALLVLGALQHAGVSLGPFRQPGILPATIVESICALALIWGAAAVLTGSLRAWRSALIGNVVAIAGVTLGIIALALRAGPRTVSNDVSHEIMLALAAGSLIILFVPSGREALKRN